MNSKSAGEKNMKLIKPSKLNGKINAPSSKSLTIRAIAAASLADGESVILNPSFCDDAQAALGIIKTLGAKYKIKNGKLIIHGRKKPIGNVLDCKESGLCMRMFPFIAALHDKEFTFIASGSLCSRPVGMLKNPLFYCGVSMHCESNRKGCFPPLKIKGRIKGGKISADGHESSQHITGLLMALPVCKEDSVLYVKNLKSKPYVRLTISLLKDFGISVMHNSNLTHYKIKGNQKYKPIIYPIEGDWSGAAFMLVGGAIAGNITVLNLNPNSLQADAAIVKALKSAGAQIKLNKSSITVEKEKLCGFNFDATNCPDLFPPLVALACSCKGKTIIKGAERLKGKESDRARALIREFSSIGAKINLKRNAIEIIGTRLRGGITDSHNDHRIAMACAIAALVSENAVKIKNHECVSKSYPEFFKDLKKMMVL